MNRRSFALLTISASLVGVAGCDGEPKPSHTVTLLDNPGVQEAMKELLESMEGLESIVDEFDSTNWRDVVPEVKDATTGVRNGIDGLRRVLGYTD